MAPEGDSERGKRRNFNSLLILANLFRFISYFIVGLAAIVTLVLAAAAVVSRSGDTLLQFLAGSAGAVFYGLLLFLASELIRLLVGIGKDISRMAGRDQAPGLAETAVPPFMTPEPRDPA
jgi:sulfite exporter TauE/SafE